MLIGYPVPPTRAVRLTQIMLRQPVEERKRPSVPEFRYTSPPSVVDIGRRRQQYTDCSAGTALQIILRHRSDHAGPSSAARIASVSSSHQRRCVPRQRPALR